MQKIAVVVLLALAALGCEEVYTECRPDLAPGDFPPGDTVELRYDQCSVVCERFESLGCRLGCPYLPDAGLDAGVQTTELGCMDSCLYAVDTVTNPRPNASEEAISRTLRCYAGASSCRQVSACSHLCGDDGGEVWPDEMQCSPH